MNETEIAWTQVTWNPASGCEEESEGCKYCYAKTLAENKRGTKAFPNGFDLTIRPHKLNEPRKLKDPSLIFVNSMSDLFWEEIPDNYRDQVLDVIEDTPRHQYQVLTKRAPGLLAYSKRRKLPSNFWAGTTIENQRNINRLDILKEVEAEIRFISMEPLLGPIQCDMSGIQWVITGGESGLHLSHESICEKRALVRYVDRKCVVREDRMSWVRDIRDECARVGCAFFHKQWGGHRPTSGGRILDGRTYDEFPRLPAEGAFNKKLSKADIVNASSSSSNSQMALV
mgnify:CR=1 FL=1